MIAFVFSLFSLSCLAEEPKLDAIIHPRSLVELSQELKSKGFPQSRSDLEQSPSPWTPLTEDFLKRLYGAKIHELTQALDRNFVGWEKELAEYEGIFDSFMRSNYSVGFQRAEKFERIVHRDGKLLAQDLLTVWTSDGLSAEPPPGPDSRGESRISGLVGARPPFYHQVGLDHFNRRIPKKVRDRAPKAVQIAEAEFLRFKVALFLAEKANPGFMRNLVEDPWVMCPPPKGRWAEKLNSVPSAPSIPIQSYLNFIRIYDPAWRVGSRIEFYFDQEVVRYLTGKPARVWPWVAAGAGLALGGAWTLGYLDTAIHYCQALLSGQ